MLLTCSLATGTFNTFEALQRDSWLGGYSIGLKKKPKTLHFLSQIGPLRLLDAGMAPHEQYEETLCFF